TAVSRARGEMRLRAICLRGYRPDAPIRVARGEDPRPPAGVRETSIVRAFPGYEALHTVGSMLEITRLTRLVLRHRRLVVASRLVLTLAGIAFAGRATNALSKDFSVPGREGSTTNAEIARTYGNGGNLAPLVAVVTLPPGTAMDAPAVRAGLR